MTDETPIPEPPLMDLQTALEDLTADLQAKIKTIRERETRIAELEDETKELRRQLFDLKKPTPPPVKKESDWLPSYFKNN